MPQVSLTYSLKQAESLNIPSLALQMLVYMLLGASPAQKFASVSGKVSLMASFFAFFFLRESLVLQYGLLLGMGLYYGHTRINPIPELPEHASRR